jgi:MarR family transcriptional repressor of mepA
VQTEGSERCENRRSGIMQKKEDDIPFLIHRISSSFRQLFNSELLKYDLTVSQMHVLGYFHWNNRDIATQKEIEDYLEVSHPTIVGILKRMESKGLIETKIITDGRLSKNVKVTDKARKLNREITNAHVESREKLLKGISETDREILRDYLIRLADNMQDEVPAELNLQKENLLKKTGGV